VKGLNASVIAAILPAGSIPFGLTGPDISVADSSIPGDRTTVSQAEPSNFSAIRAPMIARRTASVEGGSNGE
jgi:hypothetical protein